MYYRLSGGGDDDDDDDDDCIEHARRKNSKLDVCIKRCSHKAYLLWKFTRKSHEKRSNRPEMAVKFKRDKIGNTQVGQNVGTQ
jgi:hypothetical protein